MNSPWRIAFFFSLALLIGLVLVYLKNQHMQSLNRLTHLTEEQVQLRQGVWLQQSQLSRRIQNPRQVKAQIKALELDLYPPGQVPVETKSYRLSKSEW
jgi:hypothetical protein